MPTRGAAIPSTTTSPKSCTQPAIPNHLHWGWRPELPAGATASDRFRVTATGGPTGPGAADTARLRLSGLAADIPMQGDTTVTSAWVSPQPGRPGYWDVTVPAGGSYDLASFTVDYVYYVPSGG